MIYWLAGIWDGLITPPGGFQNNLVPALQFEETVVNNINFMELIAACVAFRQRRCSLVKKLSYFQIYLNGLLFNPGYTRSFAVLQ